MKYRPGELTCDLFTLSKLTSRQDHGNLLIEFKKIFFNPCIFFSLSFFLLLFFCLKRGLGYPSRRNGSLQTHFCSCTYLYLKTEKENLTRYLKKKKKNPARKNRKYVVLCKLKKKRICDIHIVTTTKTLTSLTITNISTLLFYFKCGKRLTKKRLNCRASSDS